MSLLRAVSLAGPGHFPGAALSLALLALPASGAGPEVRYEEVASEAGLHFVHVHGGSGRKYMVETMGSGACFLDYDSDGDEDLYLVQGAPLPGWSGEGTPHNVLYRNDGPGDGGTARFVDVTEAAGVGDTGWGMGCTAGDVDGDGAPDLMVTNFGADVLYHNEGDGSFRDVTAAAGVGDPRWSASAAFADADGDGDLDLYVVRYVDFTVQNHRPCGALVEGMISYCHPNAYHPEADSFYRNRGDGTFVDDSAAAAPAVPGNGLGVVWSDLDDDGDPDLYVANDGSPNFLFLNDGAGRFREVGLLHGCAVNEEGRSEAGMGVEAADLDLDGWTDLFVTHLDIEKSTLYRNVGGARFLDWSYAAGIASATLRFVGFGVAALDFDHDGDPDLIVANGHILDDVEHVVTDVTYAEPMHLFENDGHGRFHDVAAGHGAALTEPVVARGLALADIDADGDLDVAVTVSHGAVRLLEARGAGPAWAEIDLRQPGPNRRGVGARLKIHGAGAAQRKEVRTASSYLSQSALTVHAGLGTEAPFRVEVIWPDGAEERWAGLPPSRRYAVVRRPEPGERS